MIRRMFVIWYSGRWVCFLGKMRQLLLAISLVPIATVFACSFAFNIERETDGPTDANTAVATPNVNSSPEPTSGTRAPTAVRIELDKQQYQINEEIEATIRNDLQEAIRVPGERSRCVVAKIWQWEAGAWAKLECRAPGAFSPYFIAANGALTGLIGIAQPIAGGPSSAGTFDEDLRNIPTASPAPPLLATEVPQGILLENSFWSEGGVPFSLLDAPLSAGTYRLEVIFETSSGEAVSILSDPFVVTD